MSSRLIALGVRNGDSFYLEKEERSVLVDGGQNQRGLCKLFKGVTGARYVDYLVCTHADADHINGLIGYLNDPTLICSELWLPSYIGYRIVSTSTVK
jgi:beta-lactamase superfamily II metal-dependent hydrolase